jgi:hypothetical protein
MNNDEWFQYKAEVESEYDQELKDLDILVKYFERSGKARVASQMALSVLVLRLLGEKKVDHSQH